VSASPREVEPHAAEEAEVAEAEVAEAGTACGCATVHQGPKEEEEPRPWRRRVRLPCTARSQVASPCPWLYLAVPARLRVSTKVDTVRAQGTIVDG